MKFSIRWLNVTENLKSGRQPWVLIERPLVGVTGVQGDASVVSNKGRCGEFWVLQNPLLPDNPEADHAIQWGVTSTGDAVRVPIFAYRTLQPAKSCLVATGLELGMRTMDSLSRRCPRGINEVILALGSECHHVKDAYRVYIGLAVRVD